MRVLVTGGAGFLGSRLIRALLAGPRGVAPVDRLVAADVTACPIEDPRVVVRVGTITDPAFVREIVEPDLDVVYHLAAVLSGQSEAEFDVGQRVNVDATRSLLDASRAQPRPPRFVFTSTIAVFGGPLPAVVPEDAVVRPQSSYGTAKAIGELLVSEYSRRGFVDGVSCRLATVAVRPGPPNSALSSFVSGIIREPLAGVESVCPVPLDTPIWVSSPGTVTANLVHAGRVPSAALDNRRVLNLPGLSVTPRQMLDSLERLAGPAARARVRIENDERVARVVCSWPGALDASRALALGFSADGNVDALVQEFIVEHADGNRARIAGSSGILPIS
jgi:D-erythronate 2-dehydrogenase